MDYMNSPRIKSLRILSFILCFVECDMDEIQYECSACGDKDVVMELTGLIREMHDLENDTNH